MPDTPDDGADDVVVRPFADFLREQSGGRLHDELSEALQTLVHAITDTGKGGSLTLSLSIKPLEKGNTSGLLVIDKVALKAPQVERKASIFFPDEAGNLHRTDPNQLTFDGPLRDASRPAADGELRDARSRAAGDRG